MSGSALLPTRLAELARGDLAWLRAFLSGRRTRGTSLTAQALCFLTRGSFKEDQHTQASPSHV